MTSRERVLAAAERQPVDRKPIVIWPHDEMYSDVAIVTTGRLAKAATSTRIVLAEVLSPFADSLRRSQPLTHLLREDPAEGEKALALLIAEIKAQIDEALSGHADGIFYRLQGAEPDYATPMEYGGHFLEVDREILQHANRAHLNILYVEGGPDTYIDFVSDLPAQVFAWNNISSDIDLDQVRALRDGALATADPRADILFGNNYGLLKQWAALPDDGLQKLETHA